VISKVIGATGGFIHQIQSAHPDFIHVRRENAVVLEAPLHRDGVNCAIAEKKQDLSCLLVRLQHLPMHDALFLLKNALAIPNLQCILRTSPAFESEQLALYDITLSKHISKLLNVSFNGAGGGWTQALLSVRSGGVEQTKRCCPST